MLIREEDLLLSPFPHLAADEVFPHQIGPIYITNSIPTARAILVSLSVHCHLVPGLTYFNTTEVIAIPAIYLYVASQRTSASVWSIPSYTLVYICTVNTHQPIPLHVPLGVSHTLHTLGYPDPYPPKPLPFSKGKEGKGKGSKKIPQGYP